MADKKIHIDIISDIICPWCLIGYKRLVMAINELEVANDVAIQWHPFEMNPHIPASGKNLRQHLIENYGATVEMSVAIRQRLTLLGEEAGFKFKFFDEMKLFNTRKAHILLQWAAEHGKQTELAEAMFSVYFSSGEDISSTNILLSLVKNIGLSAETARVALQNPNYEKDVIATEQKWLTSGVQGVPVIIFEGKQTFTGAQEIKTYIDALKNCLSA